MAVVVHSPLGIRPVKKGVLRWMHPTISSVRSVAEVATQDLVAWQIRVHVLVVLAQMEQVRVVLLAASQDLPVLKVPSIRDLSTEYALM